MNFDAFISYRRDGGAVIAQLIKAKLESKGKSVFIDVSGLGTGHFDTALLERIAESSSLILVLSKNALDRCSEPGDWLSKEIAHALKLGKTIIPIEEDGFKFPNPHTLPEEIRGLATINRFPFNVAHFLEAFFEKLINLIETNPGASGSARQFGVANEKKLPGPYRDTDASQRVIPDQSLQTTMRNPEPFITPEMIALSESRSFFYKAKEVWSRYCSSSGNPGVRWTDVECYLIAAYLRNSIKDGRLEDCNIVYLYKIHQFLSRMIGSSDSNIREVIIRNLKQWLADLSGGYETSRDFAAFELGVCRVREATGILLDRLEDQRELAPVRLYSACAVGMINDRGPEVLRRLRELREVETDEELCRMVDNVIYFLQH